MTSSSTFRSRFETYLNCLIFCAAVVFNVRVRCNGREFSNKVSRARRTIHYILYFLTKVSKLNDLTTKLTYSHADGNLIKKYKTWKYKILWIPIPVKSIYVLSSLVHLLYHLFSRVVPLSVCFMITLMILIFQIRRFLLMLWYLLSYL